MRTELTDKMNSLGEQFEKDFLDLLQRKDFDLCTGSICDGLSKVDDNSKKIVKDALSFYGNSVEQQMNFASGTLGATILSTYDTRDHDSTHFGTQERCVQNIIKGCAVPGECWEFEGEGAVVIQLIGEVYVKAVSIEHPSSALLSTEEISSAPKDFFVWGLDTVNNVKYFLGEFSYDINGSPLQTFTIQVTH
ncbi:sperm-associated antigen 4 protein-like [Cryptotermes secundus]|uniref:sperm-associated antigen 4 protein-like n=1 Tax=Cryptotermes secundus TaxID=105785 RepID=UPI000CD7C77B|nr:sperm-associated antigen 4 protein-like [Cryptotermes secundus]XP_033609492.1 sperm-associated antigen 4 protein-like [Cryptotermes secundus]